jgi:phospholipid-transporting ATPase
MFDPAGKQFVVVPWDKVEVGSLILVETGDDSCSPIIPADLALLATSAEDGTAFVETANLDGETNLKLREAPSETQTMLTTMQPASTTASLNVEVVSALKLSVSCGEPDVFVYDFNGKLQIAGSKDIALNGGSSGGQLLQRSTKLKNTKWVVGVAVYTGDPTFLFRTVKKPH